MRSLRSFLHALWAMVAILGAGQAATDQDVDTWDDDLGADPDDFEDGEDPDGDDEEDPDDQDDEDEVGDEDEDEEGEEDEEEEEGDEEGEDDEPDENAQLVADLEANRIEKELREGKYQPPALKVSLNDLNLREEAYGRFQKALAEGDDEKHAQANAIFEIAMDAVAQSLGMYHQHGVEPRLSEAREAKLERMSDRLTQEFKATPEGRAMARDEKLSQRMAQHFNAFAHKYGREAALSVPFKRYFKMAGGKVGKGASSQRGKGGRRRGTAAQGSAVPRGGRRTTGRAAASSRKSEDQMMLEHIQREGQDFFTVL